MKLALLNCLRANEVCAGCACLSAFYQRRAAFARYAGTEVEQAAFLRCNGCGRPPEAGREEGALPVSLRAVALSP